MKKTRFFLLFTLIIAFLMSLTLLGGGAVFAENESTTIDYGTLWNPNSTEITKKETGMSVPVKNDKSVDYNFYFSIGEGKNIKFSAVYSQEDINAISQDTTLFYLNIHSGSQSNRIYFKAYVTKDGDTVTAITYKVWVNKEPNSADLIPIEIADLTDIVIEFKNEKVYVDGLEIGDSLITNDYAAMQIFAYKSTEFVFSSINNVDYTSDLKFDSTTPIISINDGFLKRDKAVAGVDYSVSYFSYDTLSPVENKIEYRKIIKDDQDNDVYGEWTSTKNASLLKFKDFGVYEVRISATNKGNVTYTTVPQKYTVLHYSEVDTNEIHYNLTNDNLIKDIYDEINEEILDKATGTNIAIGDRFDVPSIDSIVVSEYYDVQDLNYKLYFASKSSTVEFSNTSNKYFEISESGKYYYFYIITHENDNSFDFDTFKKEHEYKPVTLGGVDTYGWFSIDSGKLVVPVFTFEIVNNAKPVITVDKNKVGIIGQEYKVSTINISDYNSTKKYNLYFMSYADYEAYEDEKGYYFNKDSFNTDKEYLDEFNALVAAGKLIECTDNENNKFDAVNVKFIPTQKGAYYVKCEVLAENANSETAVSYAVLANKKMDYAGYEKEFLKYNWKSFVYLGISVVSFVGILLLLFVKPKKKVENVDNKDQSI